MTAEQKLRTGISPRLIVVTAITAAGAWLAAPGAAPAAPSVPTARALAITDCAEQRADAGKAAFQRRYGKKAMKKCIRRAMPDAREEIAFSNEDCAAELTEVGPLIFNTYYGQLGDGTGDPWTNCVLDGLGLIPSDEWEE
jgi:hypothetical protein